MNLPGLVRRLAIAALPLALLVPLGSPAALASNFWVKSGGGASCTHTTLQAAIDAAQSSSNDDTIYLVGSGPFTGPFTIISGGGITLVGGVASCGSTVSTGHAVVQAPPGKRPLAILMGEEGLITLRRLIITNNFGLSTAGHGGGLWFAGQQLSRVFLDDCRVINNSTLSNGGGIFVAGGTLRLTGGSMVSANTAVNGGGIAAINNARVDIDSSQVAANTATFDGGGIYAPTANVHIGVSSGLGLPSAVANNIAGAEGGGLYLGNTSGVSHLGAAALASVTGNTARRGGGIFLNDAWAMLDQADFSLNAASEAGGGICVTSGGYLSTGTAPLVDGFPRFTQNRAAEGSALYASGAQSAISLGGGSFSGHASKGAGTALVAASDNSALAFQGITVFANLTGDLFAIGGGASLDLFHVAIAGNTVNRLVRWDGTGPGLRIANSALAEAEPLFSGLPAPQFLPQFSCVVNQFPSLLQGMPPGTDLSQIIAADPLFVGPERGDLHVSPKSPAVDRCAYAAGFGLNGGYDRDHNFRGFDEPFRPNVVGQTYDAGADEVVPIVWDDFEAGTFAHWALTEPPVPGAGSNVQITTAARLGPLTSQRGLQLTLVNPASQPAGDAFVWVGPPSVPGTDPTRWNGSFFLDPQGLTMSSTPGLNRVRLLTLYDNNGAGAPRLAFALARSAADRWSLEVSYWPDLFNGPVLAGSAFFACAATPCGNPSEWRNNHLELQWRDGNPGRLNVWRTRYVNGVPDPASRVSLFAINLPMPGARFDQLALGKIGAQSAGTFGQIFLDEISFTR